ncbi:MAG: ATP-dependent helicase/nuclease subunit [Alphaproteobacteria bacterium]|jgi:ATP-dependent helicase/nuclease subunit B|nr:ATP-dependent helicase/nuclease subunit [Alphaproteobacteria bacterium]
MASTPRVFNIPASAPFLPTLIEALMEDRLGLGFKPGSDPLALAAATIYLPTRRACRLAHLMFLDVLKRDAAILPRIVPIGDVDEDELAFAEAATGANAGPALDLPGALMGLSRAVPLAEIILKWAETIAPRGSDHAPLIANGPAAALALAQDLARLMDDMTTRQVSWDRLDELVPEELDRYWERTLEFLKFIRRHWPEILAERGCIEPAERRDRLIAAEARRLATSAGPVVAAGSTGSIPATATLLATIAKLPHGALVLPGLDTDLDEATWQMIASRDGETEAVHGHPQFAMQALLQKIGIARAGVTALAPPTSHGRERLASEALRPAAASELWQNRLADAAFAAHADVAMTSIAVIEAANAEEEALAIAVALREAMNDPNKTAALVTPDRALARRVLAALARWNVPVDDSGGDALSDTPAGVFARLAAEAALDGLPPVTLLALLKHPLCGFDPPAISTLERAILRGPRPKSGTAGLAQALQTFRIEREKLQRKEPSALHRSDPRATITDSEFNAAVDLVAKLKAAIEPLETLPPGPQSFAEIAARHAETIRRLGGATEELAKAFDEIAEAGTLPIEPGDYVELFHAAIAEPKIRRPEKDVRVRIYGAIESRLQSVDRLVLGGLVEGVWPPETRGDPWLSRPMRHDLGLDLPERRIGLSAHDFAQALGAPEVILTRAAKLGGAPTVASRFVQRLAAVAGEARWNAAVARGARYAALARTLDETPKVSPMPRPEPRPPLAARPRRLSVTEIEDLLRDPYTIYARHVLKLQPLDAIDTPPGAADRGTLIHDSIGEFAKAFPDKLPLNPVAVLTEIGTRHFQPLSDFPEARAFWWPRFLRIAEWLAGFEAGRRARLSRFEAEIDGSVPIPFGGEEFKLTVRADRLELLMDGRYAVLDYKTGAPPSDRQVLTGLSPQLTLEAAILRRGGFKDIPAGASVAQLVYVRLRGGAIAGEELPVKFKDGTPDDAADGALAKLAGVLAKFADPNNPYYSLLHPMWTTHYGTYDHLARVQEWSLTGATNEDDPFE